MQTIDISEKLWKRYLSLSDYLFTFREDLMLNENELTIEAVIKIGLDKWLDMKLEHRDKSL